MVTNSGDSVACLAIPPGETLLEAIVDRGISQKELAQRTGLSTKHISQLINGLVPLTPNIACKLDTVLGIESEFWLRLEAAYQASRVRQEAASPEEKDLAGLYPYAEMAKNQFVPATRSIEEKVKNLRRFFRVASLTYAQSVGVAFRVGGIDKVNRYALEAWLQQAVIEAEQLDTGPFSKQQLKSLIPEIRRMTGQDPEQFSVRLCQLLAKVGLALVFIPYLKGSRVNGAVMWPRRDRAIVALTTRGAYADVFWFTLFHELGHIMAGHREKLCVSYDSSVGICASSEEEARADRIAQDSLIPPIDYRRFCDRAEYDYDCIVDFAESVSIDPQIVAGRLAFEGLISWAEASPLRTRKFEIVPE